MEVVVAARGCSWFSPWLSPFPRIKNVLACIEQVEVLGASGEWCELCQDVINMSVNRSAEPAQVFRELLARKRNKERPAGSRQRQLSAKFSTHVNQMIQSLWSRKSELHQTRIHVVALQIAIGIEQSRSTMKTCW